MPSARLLICEKAPLTRRPNRPESVSQVLLISPRDGRRPFLAQIAVVRFRAERDVETIAVERLAGVQVDRAGEPAFDHLGGGVLVDDDRAEQFGGNVGEIERLAADAGDECGAPVEFGADEIEAAHDHARAFDREVVRIVRAGETIDGHPGNALQRFGYRPIGKGADVLRGDRVDDRIGVAFDVLRIRQRLADAGDNDHIVRRGRRIVAVDFRLGRCRVVLGVSCTRSQQTADGEQRSPAPQGVAQPAATV